MREGEVRAKGEEEGKKWSWGRGEKGKEKGKREGRGTGIGGRRSGKREGERKKVRI